MRNVVLICSLFLFLLCNLTSCDSSSYVYVGESTFQRQLSYLGNGYIELVLQVDSTKKTGYEHEDSPWTVIKENKLTDRNSISDELCKAILSVIKNNERYQKKEWDPEYEIYVKSGWKYLNFVFDFKNKRIFSSGRSFVLTSEETFFMEKKLKELLVFKEKGDSNKLGAH